MRRILLYFFTVLTLTLCAGSVFIVPAAVSADTAVSAETGYPVPDADTTLQKGDRSDAVSWVQDALNRAAGTSLTVDGDFGKKTENALRDFQKQQGLPVTGKADPRTVQALQNVLAQNSETQDSETDDGQKPDDGKESALVLDPKVHSGVLLKSYWSAYFRCAKLCIVQLPAFIRMLFSGVKALVIILAVLLFSIVIFSFTLGGFKNADAGGGYVYKHIYDYSISEATGCLGLGIWLVSRLLILGVIISPIIADCWYFSTYYHRDGWTCFGLALMFTLVRVLAALIIFKIGRPILTRLLYFLGMLIAYPFRLLRDKIKKVQTVKPSDLIPVDEKLEAAEITATVLICAGLAYMLFMPDIMAFIVK